MKKLKLLLALIVGFITPALAENTKVVFNITEAYNKNDFTGYYVNTGRLSKQASTGLLNIPSTLYTISKKVTVGAREYEVVIEFINPSPVTVGVEFYIPKNQYNSNENRLCFAAGTQYKIYVKNSSGAIAGDLKTINFYTPTTYRTQLLTNIINGPSATNVTFSNVGSNPPSYKWWRPTDAIKRPVQIAYFNTGTTKIDTYSYPVELSYLEVEFEAVDYEPFKPKIFVAGGHNPNSNNTVYFINDINVNFQMQPEDVAGNMDLFIYEPKFGDNILTPPVVEENRINNDHTINVKDHTTIWCYAANPKSWSFHSPVNEVGFVRLQAYEYESIEALTGISSGKEVPATSPNDRKIVTFSDSLLVDGVYPTDQSNTLIYLRDRQGNMIRANSANGAPVTPGKILAPKGIAGRYLHNEGSPEIELTEYIQFCAVTDTFASTANFPEVEVRLNNELPADKPIIDEADYSKHLVLSHVTWREGNYIEDNNGNRFLVYPRFIDHSIPTIPFNSVVRLDCYVGKTAQGITLIPVEITVCADRPLLRYTNGNRISGNTPFVFTKAHSTIEWTFDENPSLNYACKINNGDWEEPRALTEADFTLTLPDGRKGCDLSVVANIGSEFDTKTSTIETVHFVKEEAEEIATIKDFKALFSGRKDPNEDPDYSKKEGDYNKYYVITGEVVIETAAKSNFFVRDNLEESADNDNGQKNHLIIYNENTWANPQISVIENGVRITRPLEKDDVISNFVVRPEMTSYNLFRGNATGFASTYSLAQDVKELTNSSLREVNVSYDEPTDTSYYTRYFLESRNILMPYRFKNVAIGCRPNPSYETAELQPDGTRTDETGNIVQPYIYEMVIKDKLDIDFLSFPDKIGGFITAYDMATFEAAEGDPAKFPKYTIDAIVIKNSNQGQEGASTFVMALTDFEGNGKTPAPERMYIDGDEDEEPDEEGIVNYTHAGIVKIQLPEDAPENTNIYYTIDGTDPFMSRRPQRYRPDIGIALPADNKTTTVRAYAVEPGSTPSAEITTVFKRMSEDLPYILHFISHAKEGVPYHYTGNMRVVARGGDHIFVRGAQGNFLPIRRETGSAYSLKRAASPWDHYQVGHYLTDIVFEADFDETGLLKGAKITDDYARFLPSGSITRPEILKSDIEIEPSEAAEVVSQVTEQNLRRLITLNYCQLVKLASGDGSEEPDWLLIPDYGDAVDNTMVLNAAAIGFKMDKDLDEEHNYFNITGFVMLDDMGDTEIWPVSIARIEMSDGPVAEFDEDAMVTEEDGETVVSFHPTTKVTLKYTGKNSAHAIIKYYITDFDQAPENDAVWNTYGQPFTISEDCYLHAIVEIPGMVASGHTHVAFHLSTQSPDVDFVVSRAGNLSKVALVPATEIPEGSYIILYSTDGTQPMEQYEGPITINETTTFLARVVQDDKTPGRVCKAVISAGSISGAVHGHIGFYTLPQPDGSTKIQLYSREGLDPATYKIYYSTDHNVLPTVDPEMLYTEPIPAPKSGVILAILVKNNEVQGDVNTLNVWDVTGIDTIDSDVAGKIIVNGNSIIAPEGTEIFTTGGVRVGTTNLRSGVYIVRIPGSKAVKVSVK